MKEMNFHSNFFDLIHYLGQNQNYIKVMNWSNQKYDLRSFKVKALPPAQIISTYNSLQQKLNNIYQITLDTPWLQNQRRIFLFLVFAYCFKRNINIEGMNHQDWNYIQKIFPRRNIILFKYQIKLIEPREYSINKKKKWSSNQNQILQKVVKMYGSGFRWNDVAKRFFLQSKQQYFRTPKQCRQQWINHLNPLCSKQKWSFKQDQILFDQVQAKGKKWASISKILGDRRTQHMVKNRFNGIIRVLKKKFTGLSQAKIISHHEKYLKEIHSQMNQPIQFSYELSIESTSKKNDQKNIKDNIQINAKSINENKCKFQNIISKQRNDIKFYEQNNEMNQIIYRKQMLAEFDEIDNFLCLKEDQRL